MMGFLRFGVVVLRVTCDVVTQGRRESSRRVFLLPGFPQIDLSFTPQTSFGQRGPEFALLFGGVGAPPPASLPASIDHMIGRAVHHLLRARICTERGKYWQAEYWLHETRTLALQIACRTAGLRDDYARGFDALPEHITSLFMPFLVDSLDRTILLSSCAGIGAGLKVVIDEAETTVHGTVEKLLG